MEETQKQSPLLPRLRRWLVRRHILYQNSNVTNATAKFLWKRVEHLFDYLGEMFTLHPSPLNRARSLRVAVVLVALIVIFFAVVFLFLFVFFLVWFSSKEDIGSHQTIRRI